jgi:hypothetical protein
MPVMLKVGPNPKPTAAMLKDPDWAAISTEAPRELPYQTAMQNVVYSRGMYAILPNTPTAPAPQKAAPDLESMSVEQLKLMMANLGVKTEKRMTKMQVIQTIRQKLDQVEIADDEPAS